MGFSVLSLPTALPVAGAGSSSSPSWESQLSPGKGNLLNPFQGKLLFVSFTHILLIAIIIFKAGEHVEF